MFIILLFKAFVIGISIAAPIGPLSILLIKKTVQLGVVGALSIGLGVALGDGFYGLLAGAGVGVISNFLLDNVIIIRVIGGLSLIYLGIKDVIKRNNVSASQEVKIRTKNILKMIFTTFVLTLLNPYTIIAFIAIFAGISDTNVTFASGLTMGLGVFLGSLTWWVILGAIVLKTKHRLSEKAMDYIRYGSAFILISFGIWIILKCFM